MKKDKPSKISAPIFYLIALCIIWVISFQYIFDEKLDLNGDNCQYYMLATSICQGHGFSDITNENYAPTNVFPPGYPLLMCAVRLFSDGIFLQKILNGLFLLGSMILMFFFIRKNNLPSSLAFVASAAGLLNYRALDFATMMMSEMSFLFFSVLTLWLLMKMRKDGPFWKDGYFYLAIISASYCYHIRTQGIAIIVAAACYFIFSRRWKEAVSFIAGFIVCLQPWILRNKMAGLGQSRYMDVISMANPWRPEEGQLGMGEIIARFFDTFRMLLTKATPVSVLPYNFNSASYMDGNYYSTAPAFGEYAMGIIVISLIIAGIWKFGRFKYFLLTYIFATFGVISIFSSPSGNRYITSLLPLFEIGLIIGLWTIITVALKKAELGKGFSPWLLLVVLLFQFPKLKGLHTDNKMPDPPGFQNYYKIAKDVKSKLPPKTVICTRKPEIFYMYGKCSVVNYLFTKDDKALIEGLIQSNTDYVVLDQLGYSSTSLYLFPAIEKNPELFDPVMHYPNPDTYLLKFDREKAKNKLEAADGNE